MKKIILQIILIVFMSDNAISKDKNIGFTMNQKYVCINIGMINGGKLDQVFSREDALKYPMRIKIDEWNKLHTDGIIKNFDYLKKDKLGAHYENNEAKISLFIEKNIRYMVLQNLINKVMPAMMYQCVETDNWSIVK